MNKDFLEYLDRVLPVVGTTLFEKSVAFFNLEFTHQIAEQLGRCGLHRFYFIGNQPLETGSPMVYSYGLDGIGAGAAIRFLLTIRNHMFPLQEGWEFGIAPASYSVDAISSGLMRSGVDLIVAGGSLQECRLAFEVAQKSRIPAVIFLMLKNRNAESMIFVYHPEIGTPLSAVFDLLREDMVVSENTFDRRLQWHRASDLAMNFANGLLLRSTEYNRPALEKLFFDQGRNVVVYGDVNWPWTVRYLNPREDFAQIELLLSQSVLLGSQPYRLLNDKTALVIGCGTASLLAAELFHYFDHLVLIDCKPFSEHNAVRQFPTIAECRSTDIKSLVMQRLLAARHSPHWGKEQTPFGMRWRNGSHNITAIDLQISNEESVSVERFTEIVRFFEPSLAVVGMGRTQNDNFPVSRVLWEQGRSHVVPAVFPGATHFRVVAVDGSYATPCYQCTNHRLMVDLDQPTDDMVNREARELWYRDADDPTPAATLAETWPSVHASLQLGLELAMPVGLRSPWFAQSMRAGDTNFVGAVKVPSSFDGQNSYGVSFPGQVCRFGLGQMYFADEEYVCGCCGREYRRP